MNENVELRLRTPSLRRSRSALEDSSLDHRKKPARVHVEQDSLLSTASGFDNYRGFLHLGAILLVLSTFRVALDNLIKYGVLASPVMWFEAFVGDPSKWPCALLIFALNGYIIAALLLEKAIIKRALSDMIASLLYVVILASVLVVPTSAVLILAPNPFASAVALFLHTITFLKLFSYMVVNNDLRRNRKQEQQVAKERKKQGRVVVNTDFCLGKIDDQYLIYPENLNIKDMYYFMFAPTLCYELNFPRNARIRKHYLVKRLAEVVVLSSVLLALGQQWLVPTIQNSMQPFKELEYSRFVERVLKLAIPNHLLWLIFFYGFFHSLLNLLGEALRFADRGFYNDWWNAETIPQFWSDWNIPAHKWARQHVFKPMLHAGYSKLQAATVVFLISAFFHEFLVSVPLRMLRAWAFVAMLSQVPLAYVTSRFLKGYLGNAVVWLTLILGQPLAVLMYFHDYYILHLSTEE